MRAILYTYTLRAAVSFVEVCALWCLLPWTCSSSCCVVESLMYQHAQQPVLSEQWRTCISYEIANIHLFHEAICVL
uniref:Putative secreted protein n=1 Tax=Amblyomma triste TaxID=251400 RepID=A0A023G3A3_AMBTT